MRTAAVGGAILVTGLMGAGTAMADSGASSEPPEHTDTTSSEQQADENASSGVSATSGDDRSSLVGVQAPIALDLHEGVANDLNAHEAVHDVVRVGDVVPAPDANADVANSSGGSSAASETTSQNAPAGGAADESDHNGTDAPAHQVADVADPVAGVVAQVDRVHNLVQVGG